MCRLMLVTVCQWLFIVTVGVCLIVVLLLAHVCFPLFILKFHLFSSILVHSRKVRDILVFLSVLFSCCV